MATNQSTLYTKMATTVASSKGVTLNNVLTINNGGQTPLISENPHPSTNLIAAKIKLVTYVGANASAPEMVIEKYSIKPNFTGLLECVGNLQNNVWYLPLNNIYAIKFYGPDQYNSDYYNYVYAVPAKINSAFISGLKDYTTGVPQAWVNAFVQYASTIPKNVIPNVPSTIPMINQTKTFSAMEALQKKQFSFNYWGSISGTLGKSASFAFEFNFYAGITPSSLTNNTTR
jgi:hypothetical protein